MIALIKNEMIKLYKRKKVLMCIIILIFTGIIVLANNKNQINDYRRLLNEVKKETPVSMEDKNRVDKAIKDYTKKIKDYDRVKGSTIEEMKTKYKKDIETKKKELEKYKDQKNQVGVEITKSDIKSIQYLFDHNIKESVFLTKDSNSVIQSGILWYTIMSIILSLIVSADIMSSEYTEGTIKRLLTTEVSRFKIILSKLFASIIVVCSMVLLSELLIYLLYGIVKGFANLNYPKVIYPMFKPSTIYNEMANQYLTAAENTSYVLPVWKVFIKSILLQNIFIICTIAFFLMLSTLIKNNTNVIIVSLVSVIIGFSIQKFELIRYYAHFIFINYLMVVDVVTGDVPCETGGYYVSFNTGIIIMLVYIFIFLVVTKKYIEKKNIYI